MIVSSSLTSKETETITRLATQHQKKINDGQRKMELKYHWSKAIPVDHEKEYNLRASCNPNMDLCDGGGDEVRLRSNKHLWTSTNDRERRNLKWEGTIPFDDWRRIVYGKIDKEEKVIFGRT